MGSSDKPTTASRDLSRLTRWISRALLFALPAACLGSIGCGGSSPIPALAGDRPIPTGGHTAKAASPFRFFSPSSFWNTPLPANAPLDPNSAELVSALDSEVGALEQAGTGPWIDTRSWSVPIYTVARKQPTVRVRLDGTTTPSVTLQRAWKAVPLPPAATPANGTDAHLVVWQPSTDRLWEFWRLRQLAGHWYAAWGGAIRHVSRSSGVYGPAAWPGAKPWWGASATSLSVAGGLITFSDLSNGQINHVLSISVSNVRAGFYASPARRDDGQSPSPSSLPEGARLRLNPSLDLSSLHLPRLTLMIAEAAQRYGIVVRDRSYGVAFFAQDPVPTGAEPYVGVGGYFEGKYPNQLLSSFPWSQLQVLKLELHPNGYGSRIG